MLLPWNFIDEIPFTTTTSFREYNTSNSHNAKSWSCRSYEMKRNMSCERLTKKRSLTLIPPSYFWAIYQRKPHSRWSEDCDNIHTLTEHALTKMRLRLWSFVSHQVGTASLAKFFWSDGDSQILKKSACVAYAYSREYLLSKSVQLLMEVLQEL